MPWKRLIVPGYGRNGTAIATPAASRSQDPNSPVAERRIDLMTATDAASGRWWITLTAASRATTAPIGTTPGREHHIMNEAALALA